MYPKQLTTTKKAPTTTKTMNKMNLFLFLLPSFHFFDGFPYKSLFAGLRFSFYEAILKKLYEVYGLYQFVLRVFFRFIFIVKLFFDFQRRSFFLKLEIGGRAK